MVWAPRGRGRVTPQSDDTKLVGRSAPFQAISGSQRDSPVPAPRQRGLAGLIRTP